MRTDVARLNAWNVLGWRPSSRWYRRYVFYYLFFFSCRASNSKNGFRYFTAGVFGFYVDFLWNRQTHEYNIVQYDKNALGTYRHESGDVEKFRSGAFGSLMKSHATDRHSGVRMSPRFFRFVTVMISGCFITSDRFRGTISGNFAHRNENIALFRVYCVRSRGSGKLKLNRYPHCLGD